MRVIKIAKIFLAGISLLLILQNGVMAGTGWRIIPGAQWNNLAVDLDGAGGTRTLMFFSYPDYRVGIGTLSPFGTITAFIDSSKDTGKTSIIDTDTVKKRSARSMVIIKEASLGALMGTLLFVSGGVIGGEISGGGFWERFAPTIIGAYTGYILGSSYGVYLVAKSEKQNVSFFGILASGIAGAVIGWRIDKASNYQSPTGSLVFPLAFSIIYAETIK